MLQKPVRDLLMAAVSVRSGKFEWYLVHELKISQYSAHVCAKKKKKGGGGGSVYVFLIKEILDGVFQGYRKSSLQS